MYKEFGGVLCLVARAMTGPSPLRRSNAPWGNDDPELTLIPGRTSGPISSDTESAFWHGYTPAQRHADHRSSEATVCRCTCGRDGTLCVSNCTWRDRSAGDFKELASLAALAAVLSSFAPTALQARSGCAGTDTQTGINQCRSAELLKADGALQAAYDRSATMPRAAVVAKEAPLKNS